VAVRFVDADGDRRTPCALDANRYSEGSATVSPITGATTGASQEWFIGIGGFGEVLNAPMPAL